MTWTSLSPLERKVPPVDTRSQIASAILRLGAISTAPDRKSTRLNSSHTVIYTLSLHDALPIYDLDLFEPVGAQGAARGHEIADRVGDLEAWRDLNRARSEEHTSELQSHSDLHSFPTRRSSDL